MHLGEISFCDRVGFNIKSDEIKGKILNELEQICGFKVIQKHYERFDPSNAHRLNTSPHYLSLRTNGNPYLLYLTRYNYENQCIFIDKKIQHGYCFPRMILSKLWFDPSLFDNTLLDGEMVKTKSGEWHFIINDIWCLNNNVLEKLNIVRRISIVYDILRTKFKDDEFNCCSLYVKRYFRLHQLKDVMENWMPKLPYTCRGLYFKPFFLKFREVLHNFDDSLVNKVVRFKYKHVDGETFKENRSASVKNCQTSEKTLHLHKPMEFADKVPIDMDSKLNEAAVSTLQTESMSVPHTFYVKKTNNTDIYELYANQNDSKPHSIALVNTMKTSKLLKEIFRNLNINDKVKMVCDYNEKFEKHTPTSIAQ